MKTKEYGIALKRITLTTSASSTMTTTMMKKKYKWLKCVHAESATEKHTKYIVSCRQKYKF